MKLILPLISFNSRKNQIIQEFTVAFSTYDLDKTSSFLASDVDWYLVGDQPIEESLINQFYEQPLEIK